MIAAGGQFNITTAATVTITAGIAAADGVTNSTYLLGVNAGSGAVTITAAGGITGGAATARVAVSILSGQTGTVTINAALTGGNASNCFAVTSAATTGALVVVGNLAGSSGNGGVALNIAGTSSLAITGTVTGGSGTGAYAVNFAGTTTATVTGAVTGGTGSAHAINGAASGCTLAVTGAINGGTASTASGVSVSSGTLSVTATGGAVGGTTSTNHGILVSSGGTLTINTAITGGTAGNGVNVASGGVATIRGGCTASTGAAAVDSSGSCRISGTLAHAANSRAPITGLWTVIAGEETAMSLFNDSAFPASNAGSAVVLNLLGTTNPSPADVRYGTTYGASGGSTGTLRVPAAGSVAAGVLVDATSGTGTINRDALVADLTAIIAAAKSA